MTEPSGPEALTSAWLSQALGFAVDDFAVEYFSEGAGVMAWVMRLRLQTAAGQPDSVIAKFPSPAEANREVAGTYDMYEREVSFYQDIASNIALQTPHCYYASFEPKTQHFVLLMEDIGHLHIGDQVAGCNGTQARAVLDAIAQMHASGWGADKFPGLRSHDNPAQRAGMAGAVEFGWPVILEQFGEFVPEVAKAAVERLPESVPRLLEQMCDGPVCLTHADVRLDNIFFNDDGTTAQFVDWQSVCTSAPEQDLAYFLTQSLTAEVRAEEDWVAYYHGALSANGVTDYPLTLCRERTRVAAAYLLCYAIAIAGTLDLGNDRGHQLGQTIVRNTMSGLTELDAFSLI